MPGCVGGSCLWFTQGSLSGCAKATGNQTGCPNPLPPTLMDKRLRTFNLFNTLNDYTQHHPWRRPGSAPVENSCGVSGGWYNIGVPGFGEQGPPGHPQGELGTTLPKLLQQTQWLRGSEVEVAFSLFANHGGGYQYRLCPVGQTPNEECFQKYPLAFSGEHQWVQFGKDGRDRNNRTQIQATRTSEGTWPTGSMWTKNPISACAGPFGGASLRPCLGPQFEPEPPIHGLYGFGGAACQVVAEKNFTGCTEEQFGKLSFNFGVVDKLVVPAFLPTGDYILSFRWDSEQGPQVWTTCADVNIIADGNSSTPFTPMSQCESCCAQPQMKPGVCSNCTSCLNDTTGPCAYCWEPLVGFNPGLAPKVTCLGNEAEDGGPRQWLPGMSQGKGWSPGCPKCWKSMDSCTPTIRK